MAVYDIQDISAAGVADKLAILCRLAGSQMSLQLGTITTHCTKTLQVKIVDGQSQSFANYKPKYFNRHDNSARSTYFRKIVSDSHKFNLQSGR